MRVLGLAPGSDGGVVPVLEPAVVIADLDTGVIVRDRLLLGGRRSRSGAQRNEERGEEHGATHAELPYFHEGARSGGILHAATTFRLGSSARA